MNLVDIQANLSGISQQLTIIQDYITLKFGLDFELFCKSRSPNAEAAGSEFKAHAAETYKSFIHQNNAQCSSAPSSRKAKRARRSNSWRNSTKQQAPLSWSSKTNRSSGTPYLEHQHGEESEPSPSCSINQQYPRSPSPGGSEEPEIKTEPADIVVVEGATEDDFFDEMDGFSEPENFEAHQYQQIQQPQVVYDDQDFEDAETFHGPAEYDTDRQNETEQVNRNLPMGVAVGPKMDKSRPKRPTSGSGVSTSPSTFRRRKAYTASEKLEMLSKAEEIGNRPAARLFGVDEINIRRWRKMKSDLMASPSIQKSKRRRLPKLKQPVAIPSV